MCARASGLAFGFASARRPGLPSLQSYALQGKDELQGTAKLTGRKMSVPVQGWKAALCLCRVGRQAKPKGSSLHAFSDFTIGVRLFNVYSWLRFEYRVLYCF